MDANGPILVPAYGVFHRDARRSFLRVATVDPVDRPMAAWPGVLARLQSSGVTTVRVVVPWVRHARSPGHACLDGRDGRAPDAMGVLRLAVDAGLDAWVDAGPISGGVPNWVAETCPNARAVDARGRVTGRWATGDPGFRAAAAAWANEVAARSMAATGGRVALWQVDSLAHFPGVSSDHTPVTVARFREWLRDRYADDQALAREWLRPGLRLDEARPPELAGGQSTGYPQWMGRAVRGGRRMVSWARSRLRGGVGGAPLDAWPEARFRPGPRQVLAVARDGLAPGQLADWRSFAVDAWQEYLGAMRAAVLATLPQVVFVAGEVGRAGTPGIGFGGVVGRDDVEHMPFPIACVGSEPHDAAWATASLVARSGGERPVMVALRLGEPMRRPTATALAAVAEGAVALELPEAAYDDPEVQRLAAWLGEFEESLTASTRLDDRVAWLDDPSHAGADPDDLKHIALQGYVDREAASEAYAAVREAGMAPVMVDPATFVADETHDLGALLVPTRRWIDLERYGSLVVHVLRGGNIVAFPHAPDRQRDGTSFRSTFLWPPSVASGGRIQVHDGTSALVPEMGAKGVRRAWVPALVADVSPRFRVPPTMALAITARLLPDGSCLVFMVNATNGRQSGVIGVPDPAAIGVGDGFAVAVAFATSGATARGDGLGIEVEVPPGGGLVARLSSGE